MRQIGTGQTTGGNVDDELGEFFVTHGPSLLRFAFLLTGGRGAQAEDLLHTVLARLVVRGLRDLDDPVSYVRRGIVNEHRDQTRHAIVQRRALPRLAEGREEGSPTWPEDRLTLFDALDALSERERAAVVLRYYEDLPDQDIATIVGCSRPTVRSLIHRALPKLRTRLGDTYRPRGWPSEPGEGAPP